MNKNVIAFIFLTLSACAGGGGSDHTPPKSIHIGQPTTLNMDLRVWGAGSGKLSHRYTDIQCHYRIIGNENFSVVPMLPIKETSDFLAVQCIIPALSAKS